MVKFTAVCSASELNYPYTLLISYNANMQHWPTIEYLRWKGLVSLLVILVGGAIPVLGSVTSPSQSVSQLWASSRQKHLSTSILLTIFGAGFCGWLAAWLIPNYQLWPGMYVVVA